MSIQNGVIENFDNWIGINLLNQCNPITFPTHFSLLITCTSSTFLSFFVVMRVYVTYPILFCMDRVWMFNSNVIRYTHKMGGWGALN